ncbi:DoxX family protein [Chitinophaga agrisoli]|uniref:DoxX family protein n=1 Tax=Chitinophaga agrisoli TaxID=2607653 RepID=A0A5B2VIG6_9BACT|nr:DoxX family protein [Chitinophaga agrisoli]KAA2238428.1 DoxX family protein [Chitinophaga agrisoli]
MKKINIAYWIITGLLSALLLMGSIPDVVKHSDAIALFQKLGYPEYLLPFLGIAKILGIITILIPGFPRLKEWAYAGLTYDLAGAMYSSISIGEPISNWFFFFIGFAMIAASYILHHKRLKQHQQHGTVRLA